MDIKHVAMYLRISQEKKTENVETLANHRDILTDFAKQQGYTYETFEEVLSGGTSDLGKRPELQRLLNNIEKYDGILVVELSRISRNGLISETVLQYCIDYNKPIITPLHTYNLANDNNDVLTYKFGALIASQEHALIGKRSKMNKITMAKAGQHISGNVPFGYTRNKETRKLWIKEQEADIVRYIFRLYAQGFGSRKIMDMLNAEGYKSAKGKAFNLPSIKRILQNEVYKGWLVFHDRKKVKKNGKWTFEIMNTITVQDAHEAIVPPHEWDLANKKLQKRAQTSEVIREKPAIKTGVTMLKDLLYCGICRRKMTVRREKNGEYILKRCEYLLPNSPRHCPNCGIKVKYVEEDVTHVLRKHKARLLKELRLLEHQDVTNIEDNLREHLKHIELQLTENQKRQNRLIDLALDGIYTHEEVISKKQALWDQYQWLQSSKENLLQKLLNHDQRKPMEHITHVISLLETFETVGGEEQNRALKQFIKRIYYTRNMPVDIRKLSTRNPMRRDYPFYFAVEYFS